MKWLASPQEGGGENRPGESSAERTLASTPRPRVHLGGAMAQRPRRVPWPPRVPKRRCVRDVSQALCNGLTAQALHFRLRGFRAAFDACSRLLSPDLSLSNSETQLITATFSIQSRTRQKQLNPEIKGPTTPHKLSHIIAWS